MKRLMLTVLLVLSTPAFTAAQARPSPAAKPAAARVNYGNNAASGHTFTHDGVRLYDYSRSESRQVQERPCHLK